MALQKAPVLAEPDKVCLGSILTVKPAYLGSGKNGYHVIPFEIAGKYAAPKATNYFWFAPEWFGASFDPASLDDGTVEGKKQYGSYRKQINLLEAILGDDFGEFAAEFDAFEEPTLADLDGIFRKYFTARDVLYLMKQRIEDGELTEQFNINNFYPYTEEEMQRLVTLATSGNRKVPMVVTWDVE